MKPTSATLILVLFLAGIHTHAFADTNSDADVITTTVTSNPTERTTSTVKPVPDNSSPDAGDTRDYQPNITHLKVKEFKGWKSADRFDYSFVDGFMDTYNPEEPIEFTVEGKLDKLYVNQSNGFAVTATLMNLSDRTGVRANVEYDSGRQAWKVTTTAPAKRGKNYSIVLNLYCKKRESLCATEYGFGTQVDKTLTLEVR